MDHTGGESGSADDDAGKELEEEVEEKLIDDVYDMNAVKPNYELKSIRKNWVLDYM